MRRRSCGCGADQGRKSVQHNFSSIHNFRPLFGTGTGVLFQIGACITAAPSLPGPCRKVSSLVPFILFHGCDKTELTWARRTSGGRRGRPGWHWWSWPKTSPTVRCCSPASAACCAGVTAQALCAAAPVVNWGSAVLLHTCSDQQVSEFRYPTLEYLQARAEAAGVCCHAQASTQARRSPFCPPTFCSQWAARLSCCLQGAPPCQYLSIR